MAKGGLPESIQVGHCRYRVECSEAAAMKVKATQESKTCVGHVDHSHQEILLDPDQGPDQVAETVLHEVLHAVWSLIALHEGPAGRHEELVVTALAPTLLDTLRRNPDLVAYLTDA